MSLKKSLKEIKKYLLDRYKDNLAAILVFGSGNVGPWMNGKSDIDLIVLVKKKKDLDFNIEKNRIFNEFKKFNVAMHHFETCDSYKKHIYQKGSWASWVTIIDGCKKVYSTKKFKKFRKDLIKKPIPIKDLINYLKQKDKYELGALAKRNGFKKTKWLSSHLRRKVQIINYFQNNKIIFDYNKCLKRISLDSDVKVKLKKMYEGYLKRKSLSNKESEYYYTLAKEVTNKILKEMI